MDGSFSVPDVVHGHAEPLVGPAPDVLVEGEEDVFVLVLDVGLDLALQEPRPLEHHRHRLVARHHGLLRRPVKVGVNGLNYGIWNLRNNLINLSPQYNMYYPRAPIMRNGAFIQLQNWMRQGVFTAWGIQTGPFPAH